MATNLWPNADLESGITDWNAFAGSPTLAHSSTQAWEQTYSLRWDTSNVWGAVDTDVKYIVSASTQYTASFYLYPENATVSFNFRVYDQDGNNLVADWGNSCTADTWTRVTATFTTGVGDTGIRLHIQKNNSSNSDYYYVDAIMVETGGSASAWVNYVEPDVTVEQSPVGALAISGPSPAVKVDSGLLPGLGTLSISGYAPTVTAETDPPSIRALGIKEKAMETVLLLSK